MNFKKIRLASVVLAASFFCSDICSARSILQQDTEAASLQRAQVVLLVHVTEAREINSGNFFCGIQYHATIKETIKGNKEVKEIEFGFLRGLTVGENYRVYLRAKDVSNELNAYVQAIAPDEAEAKEFMSMCIDAIPSYYMFRSDRAFEPELKN